MLGEDMAKSEKDGEQKYLVELECVKLVSLRNMDKLGRPYGKKKKMRRLQNICILTTPRAELTKNTI